jgi:hypothetical protein
LGERAKRKVPWPAYGLASLAIVAPQLLGGATGATALTILVLGSLASAWVVLWLRSVDDGMLGHAPPVAVAAVAVALWTAIQALPLPCRWLVPFQADRHALVEQLVAVGALERETCSISAAPGATWAAFGVAAVLASLLLSARAVSRLGGRSVLLHAVALSSVAMAVVALGHWVVGAEEVFGAFKVPGDRSRRLLIAPLINENHLAGHLALGWPVCLALAANTPRIDARIAWFGAALIVFATGILSLSRAGAAALVLGGSVYFALVLVRRLTRRGTRLRQARAASLGTAIVLALCLGAGAYAGSARLAREFEAGGVSPSKLTIIAQLVPVATQHPWVGVGRGAFGDVSTAVLHINERAMYPENLPLQWLSEWGWPAAFVLMAALGASCLGWWGRSRSSLEIALACGLMALGAQNLLDFSLELPGVAAVAAIALGCLTGVRRSTRSRSRGLPAAAITTRVAAGLAALATVVSVPWMTSKDRTNLARRLEATLASRPQDLPAILPTAFSGYPLDANFITLAAWGAARVTAPNTGRWLNLAMQIAPGWAGPHLAAGQLLEQRGAVVQAAMELGIAAECEMHPAVNYACGLLARNPSASVAREVVAQLSDRRLEMLETLISCIPVQSHHDEVEALATEGLTSFPRSEVLHRKLVQVAQHLKDNDLALARAQAMLKVMPDSSKAISVLGRVMLDRQEGESVLQLVDRQSPQLRASKDVLELEASAALATGQKERFQAALERTLTLFGRTSRARAEIHLAASHKLTTSGMFLDSMRHAQAAYDMTGKPAELEVLHSAAIRAGAAPVALRTASELCQVRHRGQKYCGASQDR